MCELRQLLALSGAALLRPAEPAEHTDMRPAATPTLTSVAQLACWPNVDPLHAAATPCAGTAACSSEACSASPCCCPACALSVPPLAASLWALALVAVALIKLALATATVAAAGCSAALGGTGRGTTVLLAPLTDTIGLLLLLLLP
jgi:hypothetical protein